MQCMTDNIDWICQCVWQRRIQAIHCSLIRRQVSTVKIIQWLVINFLNIINTHLFCGKTPFSIRNYVIFIWISCDLAKNFHGIIRPVWKLVPRFSHEVKISCNSNSSSSSNNNICSNAGRSMRMASSAKSVELKRLKDKDKSKLSFSSFISIIRSAHRRLLMKSHWVPIEMAAQFIRWSVELESSVERSCLNYHWHLL